MTTQIDTPESSKATCCPAVPFGAIMPGLLWAGLMLAMFAWWMWARTDLEVTAPFYIGPALLAIASLGLFIAAVVRCVKAKGDAAKLADLDNQMRPVISAAAILGGVVMIGLAVWLCLAEKQKLQVFAEFSSLGVMGLICLCSGLAIRVTNQSRLSQPGVLGALTGIRPQLAIGMMAIGAICGVAGVWLLFRAGRSDISGIFPGTPEGLGLILIALTLLGAGLYTQVTLHNSATADTMRMLVLFVGSMTGLSLAMFTSLRVYMWWGTYLSGGMRTWQGEDGWRFWPCAYVGFLGLALLFGSLLLARMDIRVHAGMRRLLFGYNAVFQGILLLAILVVVNLLVAVTVTANVEWNQFLGMYSLSSQTKQTLESLKDKVTVHVLLARNQRGYSEIRDLMDNCASITNKIEVEYVSPDQDDKRYAQLVGKYKELSQKTAVGAMDKGGYGRGLLVVYGDAPEGKVAPHLFVPDTDLVSRDEGGDFQGEKLLTEKIKQLSETTKVKVYFTQGHGELRLDDYDVRQITSERILSQFFAGAGELAARLRKNNYEVQGLLWGQGRGVSEQLSTSRKSDKDPHEVPADCAILVIANPEKPFAKDILEAIDRYMAPNRGGKLMILSNTGVLERSRKIVNDGIPELSKKYGVEVGEDFIVRVPNSASDDPLTIQATVVADDKNRVAKAFAGRGFEFIVPRTVKPSTAPGIYKANSILQVGSNKSDLVWTETDGATLVAIAQRFSLDRWVYVVDLLKKNKLEGKTSNEPISVAVAITDNEGKPRGMVIGDYTFVSSDLIAKSPNTQLNFDFFYSNMEWLADRKVTIIGISPRKRGSYSFGDKVNFTRLIWLPLGLTMLGVAGFGAGIWIVRRK